PRALESLDGASTRAFRFRSWRLLARGFARARGWLWAQDGASRRAARTPRASDLARSPLALQALRQARLRQEATEHRRGSDRGHCRRWRARLPDAEGAVWMETHR